MLSSLNIITSFKERLLEQRDAILDVISPYIDGLVNVDGPLNVIYDGFTESHHLSKTEFDQYKIILDKLCDYAIPLSDGSSIDMECTPGLDSTHEWWEYRDTLHNNVSIAQLVYEFNPEVPLESDYYIYWYGWNPTHRTDSNNEFYGLFRDLLDADSISTTVMTAIDLCAKGQLDPSNFHASLTALGLSLTSKAKEAVDSIVTRVSGKEAYQQASGLIDALKDIYSSGKQGNITTDGDMIDFHTNEFSISSSVLLPISTVIATVGQLVGIIVSQFSIIFSSVIMIGSSIFSGLLSTAEDEFGNNWQISTLASLENNCFSTPTIQGSFDTLYVNQRLVSYTHRYGAIKAVNAFFTMYLWMSPEELAKENPEYIQLEVFPNANVEYSKSYGGNDQFFRYMLGAITSTGSTLSGTWTFNAPTFVDEFNAIQSWFSFAQFTPCTDNKLQYPTSEDLVTNDFQNQAATLNYIHAMAFCSYRALACYYAHTSHTENRGLDPYLWYDRYSLSKEPSELNIDDCLDLLACYLLWYHDASVHGILSIGSPDLQSKWAEYSYGLIMIIYKTLERMKVLVPSLSVELANDLGQLFATVNNMGDFSNTLDFLGERAAWSVVPHLGYSNDFLVNPPKNRYSFKTRLITTGAVLALLTAATLAGGLALRRKIAYYSQEKRSQIDALRNKYMTSHSYADFNELRKATNKYNMTYGILTGTRFDMVNSWYNSTKNNLAFDASAISLPQTMTQDETTTPSSVCFNLDPVIKLIK